jgi:transcriptional regulator with XRE-family HTH domain
MTQQRRTFGGLLRERRIQKGFSLRKFAALVGVSPTYLSQVDQCNVDPPTGLPSIGVETRIRRQ